MTPGDFAMVRYAVAERRKDCDAEFADVLQLIDRLEKQWRAAQDEVERGRVMRQANAELGGRSERQD